MNDTLLIDDVIKVNNFLYPDSRVFEISSINQYGKIIAGWFMDKQKAIAEVQRISKNPTLKAIYITLNPCHEALLSRSNEQIKQVKSRTSDNNITVIRNLYIDTDAIRPTDTNSSDDEHELALEIMYAIKKDLSEQGWPDPLCGDSGNGGMLVYRIEPQPNSNETTDLIQRTLKAISLKYSTNRVNIDTSVYNPARLVKLLGTMTRKGEATSDRPQRLSRILSLPEVTSCL
jgi:hypothetical protein